MLDTKQLLQGLTRLNGRQLFALVFVWLIDSSKEIVIAMVIKGNAITFAVATFVIVAVFLMDPKDLAPTMLKMVTSFGEAPSSYAGWLIAFLVAVLWTARERQLRKRMPVNGRSVLPEGKNS